MRYAVALALALTLSSAPIANVACAVWCDARDSGSGKAGDICHGALAHHFRAVFASLDACDAFASTPSIREDTQRISPELASIDAAFLPVLLPVPDRGLPGGASPGTPCLPPNRAGTLALRI